MNALNIIAESKPEDNYRVTLNPFIRVSGGTIETINDEFVIKRAEMLKGGTRVALKTNITIKNFIEHHNEGTILLLKGENDNPFVRIEVVNTQLAIIEF
ncbi:hypothetical protein GQ568_01690 [Patescibacteria group bacterium]|nr:hypothetical protein [Patescibacteria group bacterium]